ncbi:aldehyde dehydrogenase [Phytoactinopolyspora alkaliphila]|uniref:Aldehyde dehydrogenase n=1 Tax=Phytoactinopolyspora alkaliphila TaxID=1783498 RepID=A0A6N9YRZ0_9ACTN|nr:aldehyde dehydrogenase family protein [Phytoactinopolyspora alkaliphila]NED97826.1 aldehyde dehydrogenase [Phytoactinopolyspora alkaliphila]
MSPIDFNLFCNLIDGRWVPPEGGAHRRNTNPADLTDVIGDFPDSDSADVDAAVAAAARAQEEWRERGPIRRAGILARVQRILAERATEVAAVITREQGKCLSEAQGEVKRSLEILDFTRGEARRLNGITTPAEDARTVAFTFRRPIGVVGLISPWNFPLAIPVWKVAPALLAGCTAVLKPSPLTPLTSALLVGMFQEAGVPEGVLNLVQGDSEPGKALVSDPRVAGISFTGSPGVGLAIQESGAGRLLKTQLELGGKNALVVLPDADLDAATEAIILGAFGQAGQRCSATSRVVVDRAVRDDLLTRVVARVSRLTVGPGDDLATDVCPVITQQSMETCLRAVARAQSDGATVVAGGGAAEVDGRAGFYVQPTVLRDVPWDSEIAQEEIFGPVLSVIDADGFDDAIRIANSVKYGMSATVFTRDLSSALEAVHRFEAGMLHVNRPGVGAYAHLPHGGTKLSQYGPPECSPEVWDFYTEWRSACVTY